MPDGCPSGQLFFGSAPPHGLAHTLTKGEEVAPMRMTLDALPVGASAVVTALRSTGAQPPDARPRLRAGLVRPRSARFPVERPGRLRCARRGHRAAARGRGRRADRNALIFQEGSPHAERGAHHCSGGKPERGKIHRVQHPHRAAAAHGQLAGENRRRGARRSYIRRRAFHARRSARGRTRCSPTPPRRRSRGTISAPAKRRPCSFWRMRPVWSAA